MYLFIVGANIQKKNIFREIFTQINHIPYSQNFHSPPNVSTFSAPVEAVELHTSTAAIVTELEVRLMGVLFVINT